VTVTPTTVRFAIRGPIAREDLPGLCRRVCRLLSATPATILVCDVGEVMVDAVAVDALARLALAARRNNLQIRLRGTTPALAALIYLMGLEPVLLPPPASGQRLRLQPGGNRQ
jgi:anti-anti-sigma regulatory factor